MSGQQINNARWMAVGAALLALVAALSLAGSASASPGAGGHERQQKQSKSSAPSPLLYHGGKVLAASTTYAIWWGPPGNFPSDAQSGMEALLGGFNGSSYLAIVNQYMEPPATTATTAFEGSLSDPSAPPSHSPSTSTIVNEVAQVLSANHLSADTDAIYVVYTSNFPHLSYCAYHASGVINGVTVQVAYVPNTTGVAGCDPGNKFGLKNYTQGTRSMADSTAHEFMEATTDPVPLTGWADKNGQEVGDKCNFVYGAAPVALPDSSVWQIQELWSNTAGGCVQTQPTS